MNDSWKDFVLAVMAMRETQKDYYRERTKSALADAKKCEAAVDAIIRKEAVKWVTEINPELKK
jgi:hypothetical protein